MYLIKRYGKIFVHVGIYVNKNHIYHYTTRNNNVLTGNYIVKCSDLDEFTLNGKVYYEYLGVIQKNILIQRINKFSATGKSYNILTNNCITFAFYCIYGRCASIKEMLIFALHHKVMLFSLLYDKH